MTVPSSLTAGDTWEWTRDLADYPAGTWTLTYYFSKAGKQFSAAATADGTTHEVSVAAATTAPYPAGRYRWTARVVSGSESFTVEDGWVDVAANPATDTSDPRSTPRQLLDAINCFLLGNATTAQQSMTINGRSISRWDFKELRDFRKELQNEVNADELGPNAGRSRDIKVRFGSA
jgi:hypothetical protein